MRLARVQSGRTVFLARLAPDDSAEPIAVEDPAPGVDALRAMLVADGDLGSAPLVGASLPAGSFRLLSPLRAPEKVLAIGLNYRDHARESGAELPTSPLVFAKIPNSVAGPNDAVRWSVTDAREVDYEAELAAVIGRRAHRVDVDDAMSYVLGYTCCNDISARDLQFADGQWTRGKSFDTFCPLGPWIVTADEVPDPQSLAVRCRLNGELMQDGTTADMVFGVAELISRLSQVITLQPGDVISTGTPVGVGFARTPPVYLRNGDVVEVEIGGIGVLVNPIVIDD